MAHDDDTPTDDRSQPRIVPAGAPRPVQRRHPIAEPTIASPVVHPTPPPAEEPTSPIAEPVAHETPAAPEPAPVVEPVAPRRFSEPEPFVDLDPYAIDLSDEDLEPEPLPVAPPERPRLDVPETDFWGDDADDARANPFGRLQRRREVEGEDDQPRRRRFGRRGRDDEFVPGEWSPSDWMPADVPPGQWGPVDAADLAPTAPPVPTPEPEQPAWTPEPPAAEGPPAAYVSPTADEAPASFDAPAVHDAPAVPEPLAPEAPPVPDPPAPEPPIARTLSPEPPAPPTFDDGFDPDSEPDDDLGPIPVEDEPQRRGVFRRADKPAKEPKPSKEPKAPREKKPSRAERKAAAAAAAAVAAEVAETSIAPAAVPPAPPVPPVAADEPSRRFGRRDKPAKPEKQPRSAKPAKEPKPPKPAKADKKQSKRAAGEAEDDVRRRLFAGPVDDEPVEAPVAETTPPPVETVTAPALEPEIEPEIEPEPYRAAVDESFRPEPVESGPVAPAGYDPAAFVPDPGPEPTPEPEPEPEPEPALEWEPVAPPAVEPAPVVETTPQVEPAPRARATEPVDPSTLTQSSGLVATFLVAMAAILAALGMAVFWPVDVPGPPASDAATVQRITATVDTVETIDCPAPAGQESGVPAARATCGSVAVTATDGTKFGFTVDSTQYAGGFHPGDRVVAARTTSSDGTSYTFVDYDRKLPLAAVALIVGLLTVGGLRWRGLRILAAIGVSVAVLVGVVLPAMRDGASPLLVALSSAILLGLFTTYLVHGFTRRTTAAALGLVGGLLLTAVFGLVVARVGLTSGVGTDDGRRMLFLADRVDPGQVTMAAAIFAGLGVLLDLTIKQAHAAFDARTAEPSLSAREATTRSLVWAREHQTGTLLVLTFAFVGAGLTSLLVASAGEPGPLAVINSESAATELLRAGVCAIGAALAIPLTGWIAARMAPHSTTVEPSTATRPTEPTDALGPDPR